MCVANIQDNAVWSTLWECKNRNQLVVKLARSELFIRYFQALKVFLDFSTVRRTTIRPLEVGVV